MHRRTVLHLATTGSASALGLATGPAAAQALLPTPSDQLGPFYPVEPIPLRSDLMQLDGRRAQGTPMVLAGAVRRGQALLAGARVEIWQCDAQGAYRHPAQQPAPVDPGFAGYGAQMTDAQGGFRFTTMLPVPYPGRPPHIHVRVWQGNESLLVTQAYLQGQTREGGRLAQWFSRQGDRDRQTLQPQAGPDGQLQARFDIVLA